MTLNVTKKLRLSENYPTVHKKTLHADLPYCIPKGFAIR